MLLSSSRRSSSWLVNYLHLDYFTNLSILLNIANGHRATLFQKHETRTNWRDLHIQSLTIFPLQSTPIYTSISSMRTKAQKMLKGGRMNSGLEDLDKGEVGTIELAELCHDEILALWDEANKQLRKLDEDDRRKSASS